MTKPLSSFVVWVLTVAAGLSVANLYYSQPLLGELQRSFGVGLGQIGLIPVASQIGYGLGILFLVPLGDMIERRRLILIMIGLVATMLVGTALSPNALTFIVCSFLVGLTTIIPQLILPFAAHLAPPESRGRVLGRITSGLLLGILLARTVSGYVGALFGWRITYWAAAAVMGALALSLWITLPHSEPDFKGSYTSLLKSLWKLVRSHPALRESALIGSLLFASFSAFWATLVFLLAEPPFHYGAEAAGLFGLVGAAGALAAPLVGRLSDRRSPRVAVGWALGITIVSYFMLMLSAGHLAAIVVAVVLLDLGVQAGHVANQTRVFALAPEARSRVNTVYMVAYFSGGAVGSFIGNRAWERAGWTGVCGASLAFLFLGLAIFFRNGRRFKVSA